MSKKKIIYYILSLFVVFFLVGNLTVEKQTDPITQALKSLMPESVKSFLKKTVFVIPVMMKQNDDQNIRIKKLSKDIGFLKSELIKLTSVMSKSKVKSIMSKQNVEYELSYFNLNLPSHYDWGLKPVAYVEQLNDNIYLTSGNGNFIKIKKDQIETEKLNYDLIETNIKNIISDEQFYEAYILSIKDLFIKDNYIYFSFGNIKDECFFINIFRAEINDEKLDFKNFFEKKECKKGRDSMNFQHIGGRITDYKNDLILFTVGDFGDEDTPQDESSIFGKIVSINVKNGKYKIISSGSRNAQGLYYDKSNDVLLNTEHGPTGGDEVNVNIKPSSENIKNFGWPKVSYGVAGDKIFPTSHKQFGFVEPIKHFTPSIGISEIIKVFKDFNNLSTNDFFVSALGWKEQMSEGDQSIHHIRLDKNFSKIINEDVIPIGERIRDIIYLPNKKSYLLVLETVPALGILKIKQ